MTTAPFTSGFPTWQFPNPQVINTPYLGGNAESKVAVRPIDVRAMHLINGEHFSGAERVQQLLGRCLPKEGVAAKFICVKPGKFPTHSGLPADSVAAIPMRGRWDLKIAARVAANANEFRADVLHAHTPRTALIASIVARKSSLPWVYHVHSPTARDSTRSMINRVNEWIEAFALRNAAHIITVSKSLRREMLVSGHPRHKVTSIANGVSIQEPISCVDRLHECHWKLGMVALIRPRKGIEVLLEAIAKLGQERQRISLDVIGPFETPSYESHVRQLVQRLGVASSVQFRGFCSDVPSAMKSLDAMVLPSLFGEGMPMVVLEALACGVPVIATKVEGTPEVIRDGKEGILAEPQDSASLAEAIRRFISCRTNWCRMSRLAVERQRSEFSDRTMACRTARVYRRLLRKDSDQTHDS
jgi:glycosyltransferase involved in cell wall biosynthesis